MKRTEKVEATLTLAEKKIFRALCEEAGCTEAELIRSVLIKIERRWQKRLTVIKQKAVSSSRHAKNVRKYINGKDALARGGWNLPYNKYWYAKMARTRKSFGHDKPARAGAKNTIMYHQVLAFLPEECSCNGGKMTPDACMAYAEQWLAKHYPHQQVILALHEESDKEGKRFAVHMAINRTDLLTGKRLWEGTGAQAKHKRASWVREMDEAWNLTQLEKGKKNSKIRDRQPRDIEKEIVDRGEYSYKNNLRELIHLAINEGHPKNMEQFKKLLASWGVDIFIKNNRVYATDLDIKEAGNPKCTFNLTRLDGRFALKSLQTVFETGTTESEKPMTYEQRRDVYIQRLKKAYSAWVEQAKASKGVSYDAFPKFVAPKCDEDLLEDPAVRDELLARRGYAKEMAKRSRSILVQLSNALTTSSPISSLQERRPSRFFWAICACCRFFCSFRAAIWRSMSSILFGMVLSFLLDITDH